MPSTSAVTGAPLWGRVRAVPCGLGSYQRYEGGLLALKDQGPIGIVGASYGSLNNAILYAAAHPGAIASLALFSPGAAYHGLDAVATAAKYKGPLVIYHQKDDTIADKGPELINKASVSSDHRFMSLRGTPDGSLS